MSVEYTIGVIEKRMKEDGLLTSHEIKAISNDTRKFMEQLNNGLNEMGVKPFDSDCYDSKTVSNYITNELGMKSTPKEIETMYSDIRETTDIELPDNLVANIAIKLNSILAMQKHQNRKK